MDEVDKFLKENPEVKNRGVSLFGSVENLKKWLISETPYSKYLTGSKVMNMDVKEILQEIGRIEHGIF